MKDVITIQNPTNAFTEKYRDQNTLWHSLTLALEAKQTCKLQRDYEDAHRSNYEFQLFGKTCALQECEYLIATSNHFIVFSVADVLSGTLLNLARMPQCTRVQFAQQSEEKVKQNCCEIFHKWKPWIYFPQHWDHNELQYRQDSVRKDQMYFQGSRADRPCLNFFGNELVCPARITDRKSYFATLTQYKIALSVSGRGEFCQRDVECMALGVPLLRFEQQNQMEVPLIPNVHQISVPYPDDMPRDVGLKTDRLGGPQHVSRLQTRFHEVIHDDEFLENIAKNARLQQETQLRPSERLRSTLSKVDTWLQE